MSRTCVFCGQPIVGERGTGMNVRSVQRLGAAPLAAFAEDDGAGNRRWFGHAACASGAGGEVRPPSRARRRVEQLDDLLERSMPETQEGVARLLAKLVLADNRDYHRLTEEQVDRYHDRSYLDELLSTGTEPEPALRARVRIREIGHHLDELGGVPLMREVAHLVQRLSPKRILRSIETAWDGIGDWQG